MVRKTACLVLCGFALCLAGRAPVFAQEGVLEAAGIPAEQPGVCLDLGCVDGKLPVEVAAKTRMFIFALSPGEKECEAVREALDGAGIHGTRAVAMSGSLRTLPFPNGYGNLVVARGPAARLDLKEVLRVLNPNGVAVIGGAGGDEARLRAALKDAGIADYRFSGGWVILHGKMPEGVDEWTHSRHSPHNNPVSADRTLRPPFRTQWIAGPGHVEATAVTVVAQGRLVLKDGLQGYGITPKLYAKDAFNGMPLWERKLTVPVPTRKGVVILADKVYLLDAADRILELDAATGRELRTFRFGAEGGLPERGWFGFSIVDGVCFVHAAASPAVKPSPLGPEGDVFFAFDLADGKLLWKYQSPKPGQLRSVSIGDGALYFYAPEVGVVAVELKTGRERWKNAEVVEVIKGGGNTGYMSAASWSVYSDGKICFYGIGRTLALDSKTGKVLWTLKTFRAPLFIDGKIYTYGRGGEVIQVFDGLTGKGLGDLKLSGPMPGCGTGTASATCIYSSGQGFGIFDLSTYTDFSYNAFRTPCGLGSTPADGLIFTTPFTCNCNYAITGSVALTPAGEKWQPGDGRGDWDTRFVRGPAFAGPLAAEDPEDWPCYRHDPRHSSITQTAVTLPLKMGWQQKLSGRLTPPSTGGGLVYVGSDDGHVWALSMEDGSIRWKFLCGGSVPVTPTFWRGRVLFGSHDGWVYCLEAATGKPAWKFRAAPEERYITVLDGMISTWPVQTGVVMDGTTAYFAAGMCSYDGGYLYALDVSTGKLLYVRQIGHLDRQGSGINPQGAMALSGERLYIPEGGCHPACVMKKDGSVVWWKESLAETVRKEKLQYAKFNYSGGVEALAEGDVLLVGGSRLIGDRSYPFILCDAATGLPYGTQAAIKEGRAVLSNIGLLWEHYLSCRGTPLLTEDAVYGIVGYAKTLVAVYDRKKLAAVHLVGKENRDKAADDARLRVIGCPLRAHTIVLAGSGIVVANNSEVAVVEDKTDGKTLDSVKVPGMILENGLAVAKGGIYVVTNEGVVCRVN